MVTSTKPGDYLIEIAQTYRKLEPVIAKMRKESELSEMSFLPHPLSPIAPAIAFGYKARAGFDALMELERYGQWGVDRTHIKKNYDGFCRETGNEVLWIGWNYWRPSADLISSDERRIQLVCAGNKKFADFITGDTPLVTLGDKKLTTRHYLSEGERNIAGKNIVREGLPAETQTCRNYADGMWHLLFKKSVDHFLEKENINTVVDFMRERYLAYLDDNSYDYHPDVLKPVEILFTEERGDSYVQDKPDISSFVVSARDFGALWDTMQKEASAEGLHALSPSDKLIAVWTKMAHKVKAGELPAIAALVSAFAGLLRIDRKEEAYIILQHFCWLRKAMFAKCQYAFPIAYGTKLSVMYLAFHEPLSADAVEGWRHIGYQLFSSLFIEDLTNIRNNHIARLQEEKRVEKQREMLQHSLPKFVFKPLEYFMVDILNKSNELKKEGKKQELIENIISRAEAAWFLSGIGQQQLKQYAEEKVLTRSDSTANLKTICETLESVFQKVKPLYINGLADSYDVGTTPRAPRIREMLLKNIVLEFKGGEALDAGKALVIGNETIIIMHLWNVLENGLLHSRLKAGRSYRIEIWLEEDKSRDGGLVLKFICSGACMSEETACDLNDLFSTPCNLRGFDSVRSKVEKTANLQTNNSGFQHEHRGRGLIAFAHYLFEIWNKSEYKIPGRRAQMKMLQDTLISEFYFPKYTG